MDKGAGLDDTTTQSSRVPGLWRMARGPHYMWSVTLIYFVLQLLFEGAVLNFLLTLDFY